MTNDEVTGLPSAPTEPDFWIVSNSVTEPVAYARAPTFRDALRLQLKLGLRARSKIIEPRKPSCGQP